MNGYRECASDFCYSPFDYLVEDAKLGRQRLSRKAKSRASGSGRPDGHSPINKLPREVLAEIFVQCVPEVELWPRITGTPTSKHVAPLLLCNVCSSWRAFAYSIPGLWQTLFFRLTNVSQATREDEVTALIHKWMKRSGALPLTLRVEACFISGDPGGFQAMATALLFALSHYSSRWEYVDLCFRACPPIIYPQLGYMPCLRRLCVMAKDSDTAQIPLSCPQLTRISWPFLCTPSPTPSLPWHQLTHIDFGAAMSSLEALLIIRSCPKLTDIRIALNDGLDGTFPGNIGVVNNNLQKLELIVHRTCGPLLERLTLPALTDICIDFYRDTDVPLRDVHEELLGFFNRSKCKLDRLGLIDCSFGDAALLKCLEHHACASITELGILNLYHTPIMTDTVLFALADSRLGKDDLLLPNLAHLTLQMCFDGSPGILGMMIMSRCMMWVKEDQLQSVDLRFVKLDKQDLDYIQLAAMQGLRVVLPRAVPVFTYQGPGESLDHENENS